jgi:hemerythrin
MATINWDESLSVKIPSIDKEHKKLINLVNSFYDSLSQGSGKEKLLIVIEALKEYTIEHFSTEEMYMKHLNFPGYNSHKSEHKKFIETVLLFEERYKNGKLIISVEVTNFIKDWISNHIMGTDMKYSDFLIQRGVK